MLQLVDQEFHGVDRAHLHQDAAQNPHLGKRSLIDKKLFLTGARPGDVDGREGALVRQLAIKDDLAVAGALDFLKDPPTHPGAGLDQRRRDDGQ